MWYCAGSEVSLGKMVMWGREVSRWRRLRRTSSMLCVAVDCGGRWVEVGRAR